MPIVSPPDPDFACRRLDPALEAPPGAAAERRRHARAFHAWQAARGTDRFPVLAVPEPAEDEGRDAGSALFRIEGRSIAVVAVGPSLAGEEKWGPALLEQLRVRVDLMRMGRAPLGFEARIAAEAERIGARGILLPFAEEPGGELRFVRAVIGWKREAPQMLASPAEAVPLVFGARIAWPSRPLGERRGDRETVARTWAALAIADPAGRRRGVHAALAAAFDAVLGGGGTPRALVAATFGGWAGRERRRFRLVLAHAARVGLGGGTLAAVLDALPDGYCTMAANEARLRRRRALRPRSAQPWIRVRLTPLPGDVVAPSRFRRSMPVETATPWTRLVGAA